MGNEEYKPILNNGIRTKYIIFRDGTVANIITKKILQHYIRITGYEFVRLSFSKYKRKEYPIHRLLATAFIPNPNKLEDIHHKDKNKANNNLDNLMWISRKDHMELHKNDLDHALAPGERHSRHVISEKQVHEICKLLEESKLNIKQISEKVGCNRYIVEEIRVGNNWKTISKKYDISNYRVKGATPIPVNIVRKICEDLEKGDTNFEKMSKKYDVTVTAIFDILKFDTFKNISKNYDFSKSVDKSRRLRRLYNVDIIHSLLSCGFDDSTVSYILGLPDNLTTTSIINKIK